MGDIINITGGRTAPPEGSPSQIPDEQIAELLDKLKDVDLRSVIIMGTTADGKILSASQNVTSITETLGLMAVSKHVFLQDWERQDDNIS